VKLEKLGEIFRKKEVSPVIEQYQDSTKEKIDKISNLKCLSYEATLEGWKINTWYNISYQESLNLLGLEQDDLEKKTIVDIWWGFSFLPFFMDWKESTIKIVDPIFKQDISGYIYSNIEAINKKITILNEIITKKEEQISELILKEADLDITNTQDKLKYSYFEREIWIFSTIIKNNKERIKSLDQIINELKYWIVLSDNKINSLLSLNWWKLWNTKIELIPTWWEDIIWIENNSIDIIIINHVITKPTVNPNILLSNANKLLKEWWKIYITENNIIEFEENKSLYEGFHIEVQYIHWIQNKTIFILTKNNL